MRNLSNVFKWVGGIILAAGLIVGMISASNAKSDGFMIFLYWSIGGGLSCMFLLAYGYFLEVTADIKDRLEDNELESLLKSHLSQKQENAQLSKTKQAATSSAPVNPIVHNGYIVCPLCGCKQRSDTKICLECGVWFATTEQ